MGPKGRDGERVSRRGGLQALRWPCQRDGCVLASTLVGLEGLLAKGCRSLTGLKIPPAKITVGQDLKRRKRRTANAMVCTRYTKGLSLRLV